MSGLTYIINKYLTVKKAGMVGLDEWTKLVKPLT